MFEIRINSFRMSTIYKEKHGYRGILHARSNTVDPVLFNNWIEKKQLFELATEYF